MKIGVSACLLGHNVRYDGSNKLCLELTELLKSQHIVTICPEIMGGLDIPHLPCEINNGKVINSNNKDVSSCFIKGAINAYELIKDCDFVVLKTKSPSCGYKQIYDGSFTNKLIEGNGVLAEICLKNNIKIYTENDIKIIKSLIDNKNED